MTIFAIRRVRHTDHLLNLCTVFHRFNMIANIVTVLQRLTADYRTFANLNNLHLLSRRDFSTPFCSSFRNRLSTVAYLAFNNPAVTTIDSSLCSVNSEVIDSTDRHFGSSDLTT